MYRRSIRTPPSKFYTRRRIGSSAATTEVTLFSGACWQGSPQYRRQSTWRLLRESLDSSRGTVRLPARTLDDRYDVRRAQTARTGTNNQHFTRDLLHRSGKSVRFCRSCATMGSTCPFWSSASDDQGHPHVPR